MITYDDDDDTYAGDDIGIPNVPAMVHKYEQERARERLEHGLCPKHGVPLVLRKHGGSIEEYCPECEELRDAPETA